MIHTDCPPLIIVLPYNLQLWESDTHVVETILGILNLIISWANNMWYDTPL